jgi:hypothetical protein
MRMMGRLNVKEAEDFSSLATISGLRGALHCSANVGQFLVEHLDVLFMHPHCIHELADICAGTPAAVGKFAAGGG